MAQEWTELSKLTGSEKIEIERVRIKRTNIAIEGSFNPPPLAELAADDQVFVAAFVRCHGSIKQMEKFFGVSYPTIKSRLNRISELLEFVKIETILSPSSDVIEQLEKGEINAEQAIKELKERNKS